MAEHVVSAKTYLAIWASLMVLTVVTAWVSFFDLGPWSGVVAMAIATSKAMLVVLFFMHVRYESSRMIWVVIVAGAFWMGILIVLTISDYLTRQWLGVPGH